ncbi:MAG: hypothetical protein RLO19_18255 [Coleofasciculus sp. G2-EDA-02]
MSQLVKAQLISTDGGGTIEFMFNPNQLAFNQQINLTKNSGARTGRGLPKVNFAYPEPVILTINDLIFDTYERGESVLKYIKSFQKAVDFAESGAGREKRPPTYVFTWGSQKYIRCFVTKLDYNLTMFLPDGTPVRAKINLTLEEIDESISQPGMSTPKSNASQRQQDSLSSRKARLKSGSGASSPTLSPSPQAAPSASSLTMGGLGGAANAASQAASQASDAASQAANVASQAASQASDAASQAASQASDAALKSPMLLPRRLLKSLMRRLRQLMRRLRLLLKSPMLLPRRLIRLPKLPLKPLMRRLRRRPKLLPKPLMRRPKLLLNLKNEHHETN